MTTDRTGMDFLIRGGKTPATIRMILNDDVRTNPSFLTSGDIGVGILVTVDVRLILWA